MQINSFIQKSSIPYISYHICLDHSIVTMVTDHTLDCPIFVYRQDTDPIVAKDCFVRWTVSCCTRRNLVRHWYDYGYASVLQGHTGSRAVPSWTLKRMRNTVFHTQKQLGLAWYGVAFGFISRTLAIHAVLGEELVSCGTTQSNQVKNWFYTVAPCRSNQNLLGSVRHGSKYKTALRLPHPVKDPSTSVFSPAGPQQWQKLIISSISSMIEDTSFWV